MSLLDDEDNIEDLEFAGEKLGDKQILFDIIAPFVESSSYILIACDNGQVWQWRFDDKKCFYDLGKIIFETPRPSNSQCKRE